jgi:hypothetical protein
MNPAAKQARRYHWLSEGLTSFVDDPHAAVEGPGQGNIVNLADRRAARSREAQVALLADLGPDAIAREYALLPASGEKVPARRADEGQLSSPQLDLLPHLAMPDRHDVRASDIVLRRLHGNLAAAADNGPRDFASLLQVPGVGARTVRALAMVAEVLHGAPCRFTDPARFSLAHGGKDRHPFPVPTKVYDHTIGVLRTAVRQARLGRDEELAAIRRLDALLAEELRRSHAYGGRSVFGLEPASEPPSVERVPLLAHAGTDVLP